MKKLSQKTTAKIKESRERIKNDYLYMEDEAKKILGLSVKMREEDAKKVWNKILLGEESFQIKRPKRCTK